MTETIHIDQGDTPEKLTQSLFANSELIVEAVCVVAWQDGSVHTYHSRMTQADLCWLMRRAQHDVDRSMFGESGG